MKPIKISIAGFNSFRENVTINFEELGRRGIFGIFGKTGSGKSTILDAITFALYGVISRYGTRYGNCVNENENEASVELEFVIKDKAEHRYIVRRSIRRKGNGDYNSPYAVLLDASKGNLPIAEKAQDVNQKIEEILGLNYDEFAKTVVLPQGSFQDFLVMQGSERRKILERIFGLGKYGEKLQKATAKKKAIAEKSKAEIAGQLLTVEDVSDEKVRADESELKAEREKLNVLMGANKNSKEEAEKAQKILEIRKKLDILQKEKEKLISKLPEIENLRLIQSKSEKSEKIVPIIKGYTELKQKTASALQKSDSIEKKIRQAETEFTSVLAKYEQAKGNYEAHYERGIKKKSELEQASADYANYIKTKSLIESKLKLSESLGAKKGEKERGLQEVEEQKAKYQGRIEELEKILDVDMELILEETLLVRAMQLCKEIEKLESEIKDVREQIDLIASEIEKIAVLENEEGKRLEEFKNRERKYALAKIKSKLKSGDICPICNAVITDDLHGFENESEEITNFNNEIEEIEKAVMKFKTEIAAQEAKHEFLKAEIERKTDERKKKQREFEEVYPPANYEKLKLQLDEIGEKKALREKNANALKELKSALNMCIEDIANIKDEISGIASEESARAAELTALKEQETGLKASILKLIGEISDPKEQFAKVEKALAKLKNDFEETTKQKEGSDSKKNALYREKSAVDSEYLTLKDEFDRKYIELCAGFKKHYEIELESETTVDEQISLRMSEYLSEEQFAKNKAALVSYSEQTASLNGKISQLEQEKSDDSKTADELEEIIKKSADLEGKLKIQTKRVDIAERELQNSKEKLEFKTAKEKVAKELEKRLALLEELASIFSAGKFAEYMAIEQLKYITQGASQTLSKITNGKYRLIVADDGTFKIQDFKNGGIVRNVKSMSGGETFVVSLSLALALSAQLQLKGRAPIELFFLDEGFGTLDDELLDTVMDSLERLANPRFNIGIVSHVEQLKQRIPVKLIVTPAEAGKGGSKVRIE